MLTLTGEYALRASIYLAQHEDCWPIPGRCIAEETQIPAKYLSKVLGDLVRSGVLDSSPGKNGGFRLRRPASRTMLFDVLAPFEPFDNRRCPFDNRACSDERPCPAHDRWKQIVQTQLRFLETTSVQSVAFSKAKRRRPTGRKR